MNDIVSKSSGTECEDTGLTRNCPKCNRPKLYKNKYNLQYAIGHNSLCASCRGVGRRHSVETIEKIRSGNIGRVVRTETLLKMSESQRGKTLSDETKAKVSASLMGNKNCLGKHHSPETKRHFSEIRKGKQCGADNPAYGKPSPKRGIPLSEEQKEKLRVACLGRKASEETRRKMREIHFRKKMEAGGIYNAKHNPVAREYFDWLNKWNGWNGRHAKNGGEVVVGNYFLDYYEPYYNIVVEWDEPPHYYVNGQLKPKDVFRMSFIKNKLGCEFYRVNATTREIKKY